MGKAYTLQVSISLLWCETQGIDCIANSKHGCDYKGYGLASRLPRLDLSGYMDEKIEDRIRPVVQEFCIVCQCSEQADSNQLIHCQGGCSRAYHQQCHKPSITVNPSATWYCNALCKENRKLKKVGMYICLD